MSKAETCTNLNDFEKFSSHTNKVASYDIVQQVQLFSAACPLPRHRLHLGVIKIHTLKRSALTRAYDPCAGLRPLSYTSMKHSTTMGTYRSESQACDDSGGLVDDNSKSILVNSAVGQEGLHIISNLVETFSCKALILHWGGNRPTPSQVSSMDYGGAWALIETIAVPLICVATGYVNGVQSSLTCLTDYRIATHWTLWEWLLCERPLGAVSRRWVGFSSGRQAELALLHERRQSKEVGYAGLSMSRHIAIFPPVACRQTLSLLRTAGNHRDLHARIQVA